MEKLFYQDPYLFEFEANIIDIQEKDNKYYIVLDKTAFYPEGGGQPSDKGTIDGIEVIDVVEDDDTVLHILNKKPKDTVVKCIVDKERRLDLMQQHTGQHLLSSVFYNLYDGETSSFHLGDDYVSIDISLSDISQDMLKKVEDITNSYIYRNLDIKSYIVSSDELIRLPLRKLPPVSDNIRIVEIDGMDFSPCCGTHVSTTGEIGIIKLLKTEKYKGVTRVYFKCGKRALSDYQLKLDIVSELSKSLSCPETDLIQRVKSLNSELKNSSKIIKDIKERLISYESKDIVSSASSNVICESFKDKTMDELLILVRQANELGNYIYILSSESDKKLVFAHGEGFDINCGKVFKDHLKEFSGRGGGSDRQAQAGFENLEDMIRFGEFLVKKIKAL